MHENNNETSECIKAYGKLIKTCVKTFKNYHYNVHTRSSTIQRINAYKILLVQIIALLAES